MDKDLVNKEKEEKAREMEMQNPPQKAEGGASPDYTKASIGAYAADGPKPADLSQKNWDTSHQAWKTSAHGRLAIRAFSRGVLGAAFFATGTVLTKKWLKTYDASKALTEQENPLQFVAKLIDTTAGKSINTVVTAVAGEEAGKRAVHFRPTNDAQGYGHSLGFEVANITFDFFSASVGDAWGRDIAGWFDPSVAKRWLKPNYNKEGKVTGGHIDFPEAIKQALKSTAQYLTYNGGEDWAVAIPYAYYMKAQRGIINKFSPGFAYDFDRSLNGGSFKVDKAGKVTGNYALEGMVDLQGRFTAYNIGTLMYREAYDYVADRGKEPVSLYGSPERKKDTGLLGKVGTLIKWTARSIIKGSIYMTPAVPAFWITRANQSKHTGLFINPEKGMLSHISSKSMAPQSIRASRAPNLPDDEVFFTSFSPEKAVGSRWTFNHAHGTPEFAQEVAHAQPFSSPFGIEEFQPYQQGTNNRDKAFDWIGEKNQQFRKSFDKPAGWLNTRIDPANNRFTKSLGINDFKDFASHYANAAVAYTPYMYAKAEFSRAWDTGKMDMATERLIDGAAALNPGEFLAGASEVWRSIIHQPLADPARDEEGDRRTKKDTSPSVDINRYEDENSNGNHAAQQKPSWQERVVASKPASKEEAVAKEIERKPGSYTEQEALRKALDELTPPTPSVH